MAATLYPPSLLDFSQCIQHAYDDPTQTLRTTATATIIGGDITAEIHGVYDPLTNPDPDNIGLIAHLRALSPGDSDQTNRITSITNGSTHALDVSIHNSDGSAIDGSNPLVVTATDFDIRNLLHTQDSVRLGDGTNFFTSTTIGADVGLDVNIINTVPISGTVTVNQGTNPWIVDADNFPTTVDTNYGAVGANTIRTAAQIGNATGAAAFGAGTTTTQVLRVVLPTDQTVIPISDNAGDYAATSVLTQVARTNASTTLKAANSARKGLILFNDAAAICYVAFAGTASSAAFTLRLTNNEAVILNKSPIYTGIVTGIWASNGAGNMMVTELT